MKQVSVEYKSKSTIRVSPERMREAELGTVNAENSSQSFAINGSRAMEHKLDGEGSQREILSPSTAPRQDGSSFFCC